MENTGYSVGNLMLKITSESDKATKSLDSIIQKLTFMEAGLRSTIASFSELSKAVKSIDKTDFDWISAFATNLKNLDKSVSKINFEQFYIKMELFKEAMQYHGEVTIFHLSREMDTFGNALRKIEGTNTSKVFSNLKKVVEMLPQMGYDGDVTIFSISREMSAFANSLKKLEGMDIEKLAFNIESIMSSIHQEGQPTSMFSIGREMNSFVNALNKIGDAKVENIVANIKEFTKALEPMLQMAERSSGALESLATVLTKLNKASAMNKMVQDSKDKRKSFFGMEGFLGKTLQVSWMVGKFYLAYRYSKMLFDSMTGILRKAIDYEETLNLWQVAMRENVDLASKFIHEMSRAYSLSETTLMNYQAIFKNMLSALGNIADDVSYSISESFLHMALDWASLFNTSIEKAAATFQAVLAGQVRPIRSVSGFDVTEVTIFELYQRLGGEKTTRQLTQVEKRLLRILAVFEQMEASGALGDLSKTLSNSANQLRMIKEQMNEIMVWGGQFVEMWLTSEKVLIKVTAVLVTIKEILRALAIAFGYVQTDFLEGMFDPLEESAGDASEAIDELMGRLFSFDKFEALSRSDGVGNLIEIDKTILDAMKAYQTILSEVNNEAQQLADHWLGILGFTYDAEQGTYVYKGEIEDLFEKAKEYAQKLGVALGLITALSNPIGGAAIVLGTLLATSDKLQDSFSKIADTLDWGDVFDKTITKIEKIAELVANVVEAGGKILEFYFKFWLGEDSLLAGGLFENFKSDLVSDALIFLFTLFTTKSIELGVVAVGIAEIATRINNITFALSEEGDTKEAFVEFMYWLIEGLSIAIGGLIGGWVGALIGIQVGKTIVLLFQTFREDIGEWGGKALLWIGGVLKRGISRLRIWSLEALVDFYNGIASWLDSHPAVKKILSFLFPGYFDIMEWAGSGWKDELAKELKHLDFLELMEANKDSIIVPRSFELGETIGDSIYKGIAKTLPKTLPINAVPNILPPTDFPFLPNRDWELYFAPPTPYAQGGFIEDGVFTMNKGEIAGKFFDGTSVVINNDSIITAVSAGVASAVERVMSKQSSGGDVYIDGHKAGKVLEKHIYSESERVGRYAY